MMHGPSYAPHPLPPAPVSLVQTHSGTWVLPSPPPSLGSGRYVVAGLLGLGGLAALIALAAHATSKGAAPALPSSPK